MQTRDAVEGLHNFSRILPTPRAFRLGYSNMEISSLLLLQNISRNEFNKWREIVFINFLIQKDFLNTCFRQWSFLLTNQNAHLITNEPIKFRVTNVKICGHRQRASESRVNESSISSYQLWILLNLREKCLKIGENRRNVQKIFYSVRKELQDECHYA